MIDFKTGDIFKSEARALINTVNCEGKMGKGLAFQFKKKYPDMEKDYIEVCKNGKLRPGKLHIFFEKDKYIINFPTKDKWRENSKIEYITEGLKELKKFLIDENIFSVAIPPLGSGNGKLNWNQVKDEILKELEEVSNYINIEVYEPSSDVSSVMSEPRSDYRTLFLLELSLEIEEFQKESLNQAVQLSKIISNNQIFISDLNEESKKVSQLKEYYKEKDNQKLYNLLKNKLISDSIEKIEKDNKKVVEKVSYLINKYSSENIQAIIDELNNMNRIQDEPSKIESLLVSEGLISYNLFNEREINYLK